MVGELSYAKLVGAVGLLAVFAFGGQLSALWVTAVATVVVVLLCALETLEPVAEPAYDEASIERDSARASRHHTSS